MSLLLKVAYKFYKVVFTLISFVEKLKNNLKYELSIQDKKGVYGYIQKSMAYNSNRIEGSTLTSEQTASLFDTGTLISSEEFVIRSKDVEEMSGHFRMFNEVIKSLGNHLTSEMIKKFHYQLKSGVFEDYANGYPIGEFKTRVNQVSDIITELPENIPNRIDRLISTYYNSSQNLIDIVNFHIEYELIHPFQDGNGRTGRAIIFKQCLDSNILPVIIFDKDKLSYYHCLHKAQVEKDNSDLMNLFKKEQQYLYDKIRYYV